MATIKNFKLTNFKGAKSVSVDIHDENPIPVITLLGLNESGKTTILEGISKFVTVDDQTKNIFKKDSSSESPADLIPKHLEAGFTGHVSIAATILLNDEDYAEIRKLLNSEYDGTFFVDKIQNNIVIESRFLFENSDLINSNNFWTGIELMHVPKGKRKPIFYKRPARDSAEFDYWSLVTRIISSRIPRITYFPSFLVDIPEKVYLEKHDNESALNVYYRTVINDVLKSLEGDFSLDTHVVKRIRESQNETPLEAWLTAFFGSDKRKQIDAVFSKISSSVSKEIIGNWENVFQRPTNAKYINVNWNIDTSKNNLPYATFTISDGESNFAVHQRSLGFRWFFSFLLFTRFRKGEGSGTIFLFDEPAANLHANAQMQLLSSFDRIVLDRNQIIYSTHSHHMVEPRWLNGAYIMENLAINYDDPDSKDFFSSKPTEIVATKYRKFISLSADRSSYYLPVLEKLQYVIPKVAPKDNILLVEGITDYALFSYVKSLYTSHDFHVVPGQGAGNIGPLLSYLIGVSSKFLLLLDDDEKGRLEAQRYRDGWLLDKTSVMTLSDIDIKYSGRKLETLISNATLDIIKTYYGLSKKPSKKQIGIYLKEKNAIAEKHSISVDTRNSIVDILNFVNERLRQ